MEKTSIIKNKNIWLICKLNIPGFHRWPKAPNSHAYLRNLHRHEFHIQVEIKVDENRAYEFIEIKDKFHSWLLENFGEAVTPAQVSLSLKNHIYLDKIEKQSVEGLAEEILMYIDGEYKNYGIRVTVMEDGENGSRVELGSK